MAFIFNIVKTPKGTRFKPQYFPTNKEETTDFQDAVTSYISVATNIAMSLPGFKYQPSFGMILADFINGYKWETIFSVDSLIKKNYILFDGRITECIAIVQDDEVSLVANIKGKCTRISPEHRDVMFTSKETITRYLLMSRFTSTVFCLLNRLV